MNSQPERLSLKTPRNRNYNRPAGTIVVDGASASTGSEFLTASIRITNGAHATWMATFTLPPRPVTVDVSRGDRRIRRPLSPDTQAFNALSGKGERGLARWASAAVDAVLVLRDAPHGDVPRILVHGLAGDQPGDGWLADLLSWVCASGEQTPAPTEPDVLPGGVTADIVAQVKATVARHGPR